MSISVMLGAASAVGAVGYGWLAGYVWRRRAAAGGVPLTLFLLAVGVWTTCYGLELGTGSVSTARVWSGLKYLGIVAMAPALWAFVVRFTGRRGPLSRRSLALLSIEPVAVLATLAVPGATDLVHMYGAPPRRAWGGAPLPEAGPLFWPNAVYLYVLLVAAVMLLSVRLARIAQPYRRQAVFVMIGASLPLVGNVLYNTEVMPLDGVDPTPFLFTCGAVILVWGFFRLRLFDLVPVARAVVVDRMADPVLVLDAYGRVVDANPAAAGMLGTARADLVARQIADLVPGVVPVLGDLSALQPSRTELTLRPREGHGEIDLELTASSVVDQLGRTTATVLVLRDVSLAKRTERRLRQLLDEQTYMAEVLRQSLRPAVLPVVPGARLAARSMPAGHTDAVSGDFYDVHAATDGRWAFVLGDVSGKGVHAAVVTSTARYTLRTLSAQGWAPGQALTQLNRALQSPDNLERFCTVVYGQAQARTDGLDIVLALGGHPHPLRRRRDGTVETVGTSGTALGLLPEIAVRDAKVVLEPGELLLTFTDGVTEARRGGRLFGEDRLAEVFAGCGGTPDEVADQVIAEVGRYAVDHDDVALLVVGAL